MTSAKPTYSIVVTEEINVAPGCKHVSQAQDEVSMKENLPPSQAFYLRWMHAFKPDTERNPTSNKRFNR